MVPLDVILIVEIPCSFITSAKIFFNCRYRAFILKVFNEKDCFCVAMEAIKMCSSDDVSLAGGLSSINCHIFLPIHPKQEDNTTKMQCSTGSEKE